MEKELFRKSEGLLRERAQMQVGDRYERLTIVAMDPPWLKVRCDCGKVKRIRRHRWGKNKSCGCLSLEIARNRFLHDNPAKRQRPENLKGYIFGRLRVVEYFGRAPSGHPLWKCKCQCGAEHVVRGYSLLQGRTRSCGCLREEIARLRRQRSKNEGHRLPQLRIQQDVGPRAAPR